MFNLQKENLPHVPPTPRSRPLEEANRSAAANSEEAVTYAASASATPGGRPRNIHSKPKGLRYVMWFFNLKISLFLKIIMNMFVQYICRKSCVQKFLSRWAAIKRHSPATTFVRRNNNTSRQDVKPRFGLRVPPKISHCGQADGRKR